MIAPAPRNHPAEDAHPAPAAAPVAVPEAAVEAALVAHSDSELNPKSNGTEEDMRHALTAALPHLTPRENARPEPVVAPLPSEAVRALRAAADEMEKVIADGDSAEACAPVPGEVGRSTVVGRRDALYEEPHTWLREYADRLVPEDDEDTVLYDDEERKPFRISQTLPATSLDGDEDAVRVPIGVFMALSAAAGEFLPDDEPCDPLEKAVEAFLRNSASAS